MSITEKIASARESRWLTDGLTDIDVRTAEVLAMISAEISMQRKKRGMECPELAKFMGVPEKTVSDWESGEYDFHVSELISLGHKLGLKLWTGKNSDTMDRAR